MSSAISTFVFPFSIINTAFSLKSTLYAIITQILHYTFIIYFRKYYSGFSGWQKQQHSANSIQETIENAIFNFSGERVSLHCGGRTDTGVHALGQVAHFNMERQFELYRIRNGINYHLKAIPIVVLSAEAVDDAFHARFSAKKRYYEYRIINRYAPAALEIGYVWQV